MSKLIEATQALEAFNVKFDEYAKQGAQGDLNDYLKNFFTIREAYEALDEERKKTYAILERMSRGTIPDLFVEKDVKTISLASIGRRFTVSAKVSASITDKPGAYAWLRDPKQDAGALITETVNASSLSAFAKEYTTMQGKDLPMAYFKVSTMNFTSVTKIN